VTSEGIHKAFVNHDAHTGYDGTPTERAKCLITFKCQWSAEGIPINDLEGASIMSDNINTVSAY
jgi:hypothetical protein